MTFRKLTLTTMMAVSRCCCRARVSLIGAHATKARAGPSAARVTGGWTRSRRRSRSRSPTRGRPTRAITPAGDTARSRRSTRQRQEPDAGLGRAPESGRRCGAGGGGFGGGGFGGRGGGPAAPTIVGGEGTGEFGGGGGASVKGAILQVDGILYVTAPDNVWAMDARDGRVLWQLLLEDQGRHAHRQPRRGAVAQLPVLRDARQLPRLARREDGQGALARRDLRLQPAVLLHHGADRRRQSRPGRHRQRPRRAGVPAVVRSGDRQAAVDLLHRAHEAGRSRARHVAEPRRRRVTAAGRSGFPASTIRRPSCTSSAQAIRRPATRRRPQGRQPLHVRARRGQRRHGQDGVVLPDVAARHARLGFGADADPDRRDASTAGRASWCPPRRATAISSLSIARPASRS